MDFNTVKHFDMDVLKSLLAQGKFDIIEYYISLIYAEKRFDYVFVIICTFSDNQTLFNILGDGFTSYINRYDDSIYYYKYKCLRNQENESEREYIIEKYYSKKLNYVATTTNNQVSPIAFPMPFLFVFTCFLGILPLIASIFDVFLF